MSCFQTPEWTKAKSSAALKLVIIERTELFEVNNGMVVIAQQLEAGQSAEVEVQIEFEESQKTPRGRGLIEGEVGRIPCASIQKVIEGGVLRFVTGCSGHDCLSFLGYG